jgi:hypothetical protein
VPHISKQVVRSVDPLNSDTTSVGFVMVLSSILFPLEKKIEESIDFMDVTTVGNPVILRIHFPLFKS